MSILGLLIQTSGLPWYFNGDYSGYYGGGGGGAGDYQIGNRAGASNFYNPGW